MLWRLRREGCMKTSNWLNSTKEFLQPSVANQLMLWIIVSSFVVTLGVSTVQLYFDFRASIESLEEDLQEIQRTMVPSLTRSVWLMDREQIHVGMKGLLLYDKIVTVKIEAEDGSVFELGETDSEEIKEKTFAMEFKNQEQAWKLGTIVLQVDMAPIYRNLWREGGDILFNNLILVATIVFIVIWFTRFLIAQPLSILANHARGIRFRDKQENMDHKYMSYKHEIGQVFRAVAQLEENLTEDYRIRLRAEDALKKSQEKLKELIKSRTKQLDEATNDLVESSRKAGMAEVATGVLHNIGNVITGVNVNVQSLEQYYRKSASHRLPDLVKLFESQGDQLPEYLSDSKRRESVVGYMNAIVSDLEKNREAHLQTVQSLSQNIKHVMQLVSQQQANAKHSGIIINFSITDAIQDVLDLKAHDINSNQIEVTFNDETQLSISSDRHKVLQILTNLISNAIQATERLDRPRSINIHQKKMGAFVHIDIRDNGIGIPAENIDKLFRFGFTTKPTGNGFGLHSSAIDATELGGKLSVFSEGPNKGATFKLKIPLESKKATTVEQAG
ncbi:signal transduction protein with periplasmic or extracellular sensor domain [Pseudobacteriovorax antillogorgiicola]|uniref:histidine kinase n=3 Tax=Pseudobacteriovorax antillogorgiicola TaxID=1513793 RepID=A0A1Y6BRG7_9BACT|nr:signal transduction protein with periplasmic or extracellular sensor domain [Pseudobacteriovorax antillogorgiicola]SMF25140.1 signal transduction protein with periplasmic or extracellular sensor domain [Pseudobacteriovorax antillogorgiicola]